MWMCTWTERCACTDTEERPASVNRDAEEETETHRRTYAEKERCIDTCAYTETDVCIQAEMHAQSQAKREIYTQEQRQRCACAQMQRKSNQEILVQTDAEGRQSQAERNSEACMCTEEERNRDVCTQRKINM